MKVFAVITDCLLESENSPFRIEVNSEHIPRVGDYIYLDWSAIARPIKDCHDLDLEDLLKLYEKILKEPWYVMVETVTFNYLDDIIYLEVEINSIF